MNEEKIKQLEELSGLIDKAYSVLYDEGPFNLKELILRITLAKNSLIEDLLE